MGETKAKATDRGRQATPSLASFCATSHVSLKYANSPPFVENSFSATRRAPRCTRKGSKHLFLQMRAPFVPVTYVGKTYWVWHESLAGRSSLDGRGFP